MIASMFEYHGWATIREHDDDVAESTLAALRERIQKLDESVNLTADLTSGRHG